MHIVNVKRMRSEAEERDEEKDRNRDADGIKLKYGHMTLIFLNHSPLSDSPRNA